MSAGLWDLAARPDALDAAAHAWLGMGEKVVGALSATVPFPKRLGKPEEYAAMALTLIENGYMNGECVRLDGGIRMPPR